MSDDTTAAVRAFFGALMRSEFDTLAERLADDVVFEFPGTRFGGRFEGKRRVGAFLKSNQRLFRDGLRFDLHWVGRDGDRVVAQWTNHGVTRAGTEYANRGVSVFRFDDDGRVAEIQDYLDTERVTEAWPPRGG